MDLETLKRKAAAALQFSVPASAKCPASFTLRLPTRFEASVCYTRVAQHEGARDPAAMVRLQRALLLGAVVGWEGVRKSHLLPGLPPEQDGALEFDPAAVELLLDAQPDWEEALTAELLAKRSQRAAVEDTATKNS
jgi:hypothetical protein